MGEIRGTDGTTSSGLGGSFVPRLFRPPCLSSSGSECRDVNRVASREPIVGVLATSDFLFPLGCPTASRGIVLICSGSWHDFLDSVLPAVITNFCGFISFHSRFDCRNTDYCTRLFLTPGPIPLKPTPSHMCKDVLLMCTDAAPTLTALRVDAHCVYCQKPPNAAPTTTLRRRITSEPASNQEHK